MALFNMFDDQRTDGHLYHIPQPIDTWPGQRVCHKCGLQTWECMSQCPEPASYARQYQLKHDWS